MADPPPEAMAEPALTLADVYAALHDMQTYMDVTPEDLLTLYTRAQHHARTRRAAAPWAGGRARRRWSAFTSIRWRPPTAALCTRRPVAGCRKIVEPGHAHPGVLRAAAAAL